MRNAPTFTQRGLVALAAVAVLLALAGSAPASAGAYTEDFRLQDCHWRVTGGNPYFSLRAGRQLVLEGEEDGALIRNEITMLRQYERLDFEYDGREYSVRTRVMEERESEDGELVEVSRNFVARCAETGDIYYFGEDVDDYEDGEIVSHEGAWRVGEDDARPGILMPGTFLKGARYFQEVAPENDAMDRAQHVEMGLEIETEVGTFDDCVAVRETTPLDPESEGFKFYCPGVGIVIDEDLELVEINQVSGNGN